MQRGKNTEELNLYDQQCSNYVSVLKIYTCSVHTIVKTTARFEVEFYRRY